MRGIIMLGVILLSIFGNVAYVFAETSYLYYYGQWCPHCANVDEYMVGVDGYKRLNIEKKEVYFNQENATAMNVDAERLGIEEGAGVPFLIINEDGNESYLIGDISIIDYFIPILGEPKPNNNKTIALIILVVLAILIPSFFIFWWKKS